MDKPPVHARDRPLKMEQISFSVWRTLVDFIRPLAAALLGPVFSPTVRCALKAEQRRLVFELH